ncbi:transposable element Tc3 transposase [Trichonephila clavipes]|nr:transposable element Tc3 transposase [Trichonephila clavipes]
MFSDESRFSLSSDSRWVTIERERGTRFEPRNITERHHFPSRGVMVWAGIMMDSSTDLHFVDTGSVTAQGYRDEVLEHYVRLFRGAVEHVWDMLGRQIAALSYPPSSVTELKRALQEAWNRLSPQLIHHLIASMVNRCAACLVVRGDHTPH